MDDNVPIQRAKIVKDYLTDNHINATKWQAPSPDINIIENILLHMKRTLLNVGYFVNSQ